MLRIAPLQVRVAPHRERGFTLVEILVVMVLMAITLSLAVVRLATDDRETLREEASRLAISLSQAQDEAVVTGVAIAWHGVAEGYQYFRRGADREWRPLQTGDALPAHRLPLSVRLVDVEVGGLKIAPGALVVLPPSALAPPVRIVLATNNDQAAVEVGTTARVVFNHGS
ncbi:MAG: GspH/FimT family pseudopilin [Burkholderiales bacterium]